MESTPNHSNAEDDAKPKKMGEMLREARLQKGLSVADVAAQIRLAPRQIEALEADDLAQLPELPFVRGFVRSYAKLLQLDDVPLLASLPEAHMISERIEPLSVDVPFNIKQLSKQQNKIWLMASAGLLLVALVFAIWHFNTPKTVPALSPSTASENTLSELAVSLPESAVVASSVSANVPLVVELPVSAIPPAQTSAVASAPTIKRELAQPAIAVSSVINAQSALGSTNKLHLVFEGESWTKITDSSGQVLSSQLNLAGSELSLAGVAPYDLIIGNAKAVRLYRRGKSVDLTSHINPSNEVARLTLE